MTGLVPPGAPLVLGAEAPVARRRGRRIKATGWYRAAVRSPKPHGIRGFGRNGVVMRRLLPVPWSRRVGAVPWLTPLGRPAEKHAPRRPKTRSDGVRQMLQPVRRWLPGHRLVWVVDGGCAAVSLARACITPPVVRGSRRRWEAALYQPPGPQPPGQRGPTPRQGPRHRRGQAWAERADTPWDTVAGAWSGGQRQPLGVFSHTALGYTPRLLPVAIR
jgi:hypothetical protein